MKAILIPALILIIALLLSIGNISLITAKTNRLLDLLDESLLNVQAGDLEGGRGQLAEAQRLWERDKTYFCSVLRHSETDEIYTAFQLALDSLDSNNTANYRCQCSELISHIELIRETEAITFGNVM